MESDEDDEAPTEDEGADPVEVLTAVPRAGLSVLETVADGVKKIIQGDEPETEESENEDEQRDEQRN